MIDDSVFEAADIVEVELRVQLGIEVAYTLVVQWPRTSENCCFGFGRSTVSLKLFDGVVDGTFSAPIV